MNNDGQKGSNSNRIGVKIKFLRDDVKMPEYSTPGSAALDLRSAADDFVLMPQECVQVPTGIAIAPEGFGVVGIIAGRSGLGAKYGVTLRNCIGVIDADYRGEISVPLVNHGKEPFRVAKGDRIAQLMFLPVFAADLIPVDTLDDTERGASGFGSTGIK